MMSQWQVPGEVNPFDDTNITRRLELLQSFVQQVFKDQFSSIKFVSSTPEGITIDNVCGCIILNDNSFDVQEQILSGLWHLSIRNKTEIHGLSIVEPIALPSGHSMQSISNIQWERAAQTFIHGINHLAPSKDKPLILQLRCITVRNCNANGIEGVIQLSMYIYSKY